MRDNIKQIFENKDFIIYNGWFFKADWKNIKIRQFAGDNHSWLVWNNGEWLNGIWYNGWWKNGIWKGGTWKKGTWTDGTWYNGSWLNGTWIKGKIWNAKIKQYKESEVSPNKCKWSSSYEGQYKTNIRRQEYYKV